MTQTKTALLLLGLGLVITLGAMTFDNVVIKGNCEFVRSERVFVAGKYEADRNLYNCGKWGSWHVAP